MLHFPEQLVYKVSDLFDTIVDFILKNFDGFFEIIRRLIAGFFDGTLAAVSFIPWWLYIIIVLVLGIKLYNIKTGIILSLMLFAIGMFGLWDMMIYTLAIVLISVLVAVVIGLPTGIWMAKSKRLEGILKPLLDMMQTMPSFVYLIPAVMLFNLGKVPAVFATTIYALPPLIRLTYLGITNVDAEVVEAGKAFGSTPLQMLFKIEIPQALSTIMTGVNQTTMMAMAMVVIASMIGAEGIGQEVLLAIRRLEVGRGFQAGLAIVFLAIILDRILQGFVKKFERGEA
ncbi:MAG: choline ABC transporter permease subunit [Tenericutes bacterium HGW-Tenericutes-8]|nr:MAG: choline ABC transporter permease subunit [Tenericutes bacterium HGW-Tenericutes-8]